MATTVQIGHARGGPGHGGKDANGNVFYNPGEQGEELRVQTWYNQNSKRNGWHEIIRCKDANVVSAVVAANIKLCNSPLVGYNQYGRNTLYYALKRNGWSVDRYLASGEPTETDCSAYVYTLYCIAVPSLRDWMTDPGQVSHKDHAGKTEGQLREMAKAIDDREHSNCTYNGNIWEIFHRFGGGKFEIYTYKSSDQYADYLNQSEYINNVNNAKLGDIYNYYYAQGDGHAVMVVSLDGTAPTQGTAMDGRKTYSKSSSIGGSSSRSSSSSGGFSNRVRNISAATNITNTENNKVPLLATVSDFYKDKVLDKGSNRMEEFKSLKETLSNSAGNMGMDIYLPEELFDTNILKGSQESKTVTT